MTCIAELDDYSEFFFFFFFFSFSKISLYFEILLLCGLFQTGLFARISADDVTSVRPGVNGSH